MLEGINVLNKVDILTDPSWLVPTMIGLVVVGIIIGIILGIVGKCSPLEYLMASLLFAMFAMFIGLILAVVVAVDFQVPTGRYTYQVTIEDSVNFKEFNDTYNVLKHEGEIYTITVK